MPEALLLRVSEWTFCVSPALSPRCSPSSRRGADPPAADHKSGCISWNIAVNSARNLIGSLSSGSIRSHMTGTSSNVSITAAATVVFPDPAGAEISVNRLSTTSPAMRSIRCGRGTTSGPIRGGESLVRGKSAIGSICRVERESNCGTEVIQCGLEYTMHHVHS
jgi:hypothetical protein